MGIVDEQVMKIFDTEWRECRRNVFTQVEDLLNEEGVGDLDDEQFEGYVLSYFQNRITHARVTIKHQYVFHLVKINRECYTPHLVNSLKETST